jgi:hypothetical protein
LISCAQIPLKYASLHHAHKTKLMKLKAYSRIIVT